MLKVVVYDSGFGGELFADELEEELPIVKVIRVIDWRNAENFLKSPKIARKTALEALRPYIGRADLIIFANYFLTTTSLKYFSRKFKNQKFLGLKLPLPSTFMDRPTAILATKNLAHTISYHNYIFSLKRKTETLCLDTWPALIDDGELTTKHIREKFEELYQKTYFRPAEVILACGQFNDIIPNLREVLGPNLKIHDSFKDTITLTAKTLKLRGGLGTRKK